MDLLRQPAEHASDHEDYSLVGWENIDLRSPSLKSPNLRVVPSS